MKLYNTASHQLEDLKPMNNRSVSLYTCGPTVYSEPHIGNWASFIRWDILVRALEEIGYDVNRVMNITDVGHLTSDADEGEDKMQKGARREGLTEWEVAAKYTGSFADGMKALNMRQPSHLVKATDHIAEQIELIKQLELKGYTYLLDDGLYFDTARFSKYGDFARLNLEGLRAGARVAHHSCKRSISDFVLWRKTPAGESRAMEWDSPWGKGIPGWHIECSAMAIKYLGETIDIHTGGIDHIPVHHTNEIAQSEAATGKVFARYWLHNAHLLSEGSKLSKSLNNSYTLDELSTKGFSSNDFRMFILQSHYRTESNFTWENMTSAQQRFRRWKATAGLRWQLGPDQQQTSKELSTATENCVDALGDDLNTPQAIIAIEQGLSLIENAAHACLPIDHNSVFEFMHFIERTTGLQLIDQTTDISDKDKELIADRLNLRRAKDWTGSDRIRDELLKKEIRLHDHESGTYWEKI